MARSYHARSWVVGYGYQYCHGALTFVKATVREWSKKYPDRAFTYLLYYGKWVSCRHRCNHKHEVYRSLPPEFAVKHGFPKRRKKAKKVVI